MAAPELTDEELEELDRGVSPERVLREFPRVLAALRELRAEEGFTLRQCSEFAVRVALEALASELEREARGCRGWTGRIRARYLRESAARARSWRAGPVGASFQPRNPSPWLPAPSSPGLWWRAVPGYRVLVYWSGEGPAHDGDTLYAVPGSAALWLRADPPPIPDQTGEPVNLTRERCRYGYDPQSEG